MPCMVGVAVFVGVLVLVLGPALALRRRKGRRFNKEWVVPAVLSGAAAVGSFAASAAWATTGHPAWQVAAFAVAGAVMIVPLMACGRRL